MATMTPRSHALRGLWALVLVSCVLTVTTDAAQGRTPRPSAPPVLTLIEAADLLRIDADELRRLAERRKFLPVASDRPGGSVALR